MTSPGPVPPLAPDELVSTGGERQVLETFLDLYRDILKRKLAGLSDQQIRQRHPSLETSRALPQCRLNRSLRPRSHAAAKAR